MYQFIFSNLFPKYFCKFDSRGIENNIEFTSYYSNYLNQKNIIEWQSNNQYWEEQTKNFEKKDSLESNSDSEVEIIDLKKVKKEEKEEEKKNILKRKMEIKKKNLEDKLKENTEKLRKLKKTI